MTRIDGSQVCAVGDHAKLVERHVGCSWQNRRPSDGETATMKRIEPRPVGCGYTLRRDAVVSGCGRKSYDRSGTWQANALRNPTVARMPIARAAEPAVQHRARVVAVDDVRLHRPGEPRKPQRRSRIHAVPARNRVQRHLRRRRVSGTSGLHSALSLQTTGANRRRSSAETTETQVARLPAQPQAVDDVQDGLRQNQCSYQPKRLMRHHRSKL